MFLRALVRGDEPVKAAMAAGCKNKNAAWKFIRANDRDPAFRSELKRVVEKTKLNDQFFMDKLIELLSIKKPYSYVDEDKQRKVEWIPDGPSIASGLKIWSDLRDRLQGEDKSSGVVVRVDGLRELMRCTGLTAQQLLDSGKIKAVEVTGEVVDADTIDAVSPKAIEGVSNG